MAKRRLRQMAEQDAHDPVRISNAIVCDEVRREDNGKQFIIGVYANRLLVEQFPAALRLAAWFEYSPIKAGEQTMIVRFGRAGNEENNLKFKLELTVQKAEPFPISVPPQIIEFPERGELLLEVSSDGKDWHAVLRKMVITKAEHAGAQ